MAQETPKLAPILTIRGLENKHLPKLESFSDRLTYIFTNPRLRVANKGRFGGLGWEQMIQTLVDAREWKLMDYKKLTAICSNYSEAFYQCLLQQINEWGWLLNSHRPNTFLIARLKRVASPTGIEGYDLNPQEEVAKSFGLQGIAMEIAFLNHPKLYSTKRRKSAYIPTQHYGHKKYDCESIKNFKWNRVLNLKIPSDHHTFDPDIFQDIVDLYNTLDLDESVLKFRPDLTHIGNILVTVMPGTSTVSNNENCSLSLSFQFIRDIKKNLDNWKFEKEAHDQGWIPRPRSFPSIEVKNPFRCTSPSNKPKSPSDEPDQEKNKVHLT